MNKTTGALIIGGNLNGLSIARSLGRQGIPAWVTSPPDIKLAGCSRYTQRTFSWPSGDNEAQAAHLIELAERFHLDHWVLFPTSDQSAALLAKFHAVLSQRFRVSTPTWQVLQWAYDKRLTYQLAAEQGVDFPATLSPASEAQPDSIPFEFPVILKPATHEVMSRFVADKAWPAANSEELLARYRQACELIPRDLILIQERIPGGGESQFSFAALCKDGEPVATLTARRTRQYPIDFGYSSSFVETMDVPEIEALSRRLLAAIAYTGLVEVEFKFDARTGRYKLLDINPRLWTWSTLGARAGVDFPYLLWRMLMGKPVPKRTARTGVRWMRASTDVPAAIHEILRGRLNPKAYLHSLRGPIEFALVAEDDPFPGLMDLPLYLYKHLHKLGEVFRGVSPFRAGNRHGALIEIRSVPERASSLFVSAEPDAPTEQESK